MSALAVYADAAERDGLRMPVSSSNLTHVWYQADFARLFVWFWGDGRRTTRYAYDGVDEGVFEGLVSAPSQGVYLNEVLKKGGYAYSGPF